MHPLGVLDSGGRPTEVIIDRDTRYGINAYDYFVEKIGRTPRTTEKVHFIVATDIDTVIRYLGPSSYGLPPHAVNELIALKNSFMTEDKCIVDIEKQKLVRDAIECYRQTGKWE